MHAQGLDLQGVGAGGEVPHTWAAVLVLAGQGQRKGMNGGARLAVLDREMARTLGADAMERLSTTRKSKAVDGVARLCWRCSPQGSGGGWERSAKGRGLHGVGYAASQGGSRAWCVGCGEEKRRDEQKDYEMIRD